MSSQNIARWRAYIENHTPDVLDDLLHDDVVFISPVVHTPQQGKAKAKAYLAAADKLFAHSNFTYTQEFDCGTRAALEFTAELDGIHINGMDLIRWDANGKILEFKVLIRPLKAIQTVHAKMGQILAAAEAAA